MYRIEDRFGNVARTVTTTDATQTIVDSFDVLDGEICFVRITVIATEAGGVNRAATVREALVYNTGSGATIQGAVEETFLRGSTGVWDLDITVSGDEVHAAVTGQAGKTINWKCSMESLGQ